MSATATRAKPVWDVQGEVQTVADAVRIGREVAQQLFATAALLSVGDEVQTEALHLIAVESASELNTAEVPRAIESTENEPPKE